MLHVKIFSPLPQTSNNSVAMLLVSDVNVLVLDEPTNYLGIPSIEALESLLPEYEGTLIFVSHDTEFIAHIATQKISIVDGKIKQVPLGPCN